MQTSPDRRVALATTVSLPGPFARRRRTVNDPLGGFVVAAVETTLEPLRVSVTVHRTPLRFWSTSNSTSMRPFSGLSVSFEVEPPVQRPWARTVLSPPRLARAAAGARATDAAAMPSAARRRTFISSTLIG